MLLYIPIVPSYLNEQISDISFLEHNVIKPLCKKTTCSKLFKKRASVSRTSNTLSLIREETCRSFRRMSMIKAIMVSNPGSGLPTNQHVPKAETHSGFKVYSQAVSVLASPISTAHYFWILKLLLSKALNLHASL